MPNTGKPSQDCHLCRRRRVKCDLQRPQCARCIKYGVACPGYRNRQDLVFRNASADTIELKRQRGPRRSTGPCQQQQQQEEEEEEEEDQEEEEGRQGRLVLARSLAEHWKTQSIPILLNIYDIGFIHDLFAAHGPDGPLVWAAHLFSRAYVVNVRNPTAVSARARGDAQRELGEYLGRTLRIVSGLLETGEGAGRDDVLATVWILAGYELLIGTQGVTRTRGNTWHLHTRGLYSILRSRASGHIRTPAGHMSFWPAFTMIQTEALATGTPCPPESTAWLDAIHDTLIPGEALALAISRFVVLLAAAQHEMLAVLHARDFPAAAAVLPRVLAGMAAARARLREAYAANTERHESDLCLVNLARSACVKGFHIAHLLINFLTHWPGLGTGTGTGPGMATGASRGAGTGMSLGELLRARERCLAQVRAAARAILDSVPQALDLWSWAGGGCGRDATAGQDTRSGDDGNGRGKGEKGKASASASASASHKVVFDALKLMWPLIAVCTIPSTGQEQRLRARAVLEFVGRDVGVRQALGVREVLNLRAGEESLPVEAESPLLEGFGLLSVSE